MILTFKEKRMKRFQIIICSVWLLAGFTLFASPQTGKAAEPQTLNIIENDWPPYYFADKSDEFEGFAKELLKMIISETEYTCKFTFYPVKRMYLYMEKGKLDIALFSYKKERESFVVYGKEPLFTSGYRPIVLAESDNKIRSLKDFDTLRIGHLAGLKYSRSFLEYVEKRKRAGTLVTTTIPASA